MNIFNATAYGDNLYKSIVPNIATAHRRAKRRSTALSLLLGICFIVMVVSIVLFIATGERTVKKGWEGHYDAFGSSFGNTKLHPNMVFLPGIIIGAIGFVIFIVFISICGARVLKLRALKTLVSEIQAQEKVSFAHLSISQGFRAPSTASIIRIVNRLIETGDLQNYEVIDEVGVARTSIHARSSDFSTVNAPIGIGARVSAAISAFTHPASAQAQPAQPPQPRATHCAGCGSAIKKGSGRFCEFCGTRLD